MVEDENPIDIILHKPGNIALEEATEKMTEDYRSEVKESSTEGVLVPPAEGQSIDNITVDHTMDV